MSTLLGGCVSWEHPRFLTKPSRGGAALPFFLETPTYSHSLWQSDQIGQSYRRGMFLCSSMAHTWTGPGHQGLYMPRTRTCLGDRAFGVAGPRLWNALPISLRLPHLSLGQFRLALKTHLF